jgi:hypothetical protein
MIDLSRVTAPLRPLRRSKATARSVLSVEQTREFVGELMPDMHALRVVSLANGVVGVLNAAVLSIHAIGQAYAQVAKIRPKSGIKQVDRTLSNDKVAVDDVLANWVPFVIGAREQVVVLLDWTEFPEDDQATLCAYVATSHGRATPLAWKTVPKKQRKGRRTSIEQDFVTKLHSWVKPHVQVTLVADRGFGGQGLYELLLLYGWDFVIRFRGNILVEHAGDKRRAVDWLGAQGRAKMLRNVRVTDDGFEVPAVVVVHDRRMKDVWCLATSLNNKAASEIVRIYAKRMTIEESFRDAKDLHFGLGLSATHIRDADRRDRLLLLVAIAVALLTLLGAAGEKAGLDRLLKANTVQRRTHSLFRQGVMLYKWIPTMRQEWLRPLMNAFDEIVRQQPFFRKTFEII